MSIIIQNMGGPADGVCNYDLRINRKLIAQFQHDRLDGLAICLEKAAEAARAADEVEMLQYFFEAMNHAN